MKIGPVYLEVFDKIRRTTWTHFPFVSLFFAETTGPIFTKILHVIVAFVVLLYCAYTRRYTIPFPNGIAIKVIGPGKRRFFDFDWLPWQRPMKNQIKAQSGEQALTPIYQSWNFGEDCSISVWPTWTRKSIIKKKIKKTSAKYIALPASLPSVLKYKQEKKEASYKKQKEVSDKENKNTDISI